MSWNDYGEQAFSFEIVEECEIDELDELEIAYIMKYNTMDQDFGYNLESGGNTNKTDSPETRAKKSKNHAKYWLGKPRSEETKNKISETNKGWKHSEEEKLELSRRSNSTGFYRVHKQNNKNCKQGFIWKYSYYENKKRKSIYDTKFSKLMLKVTLKDLPWKIVDIDKAMNTINEINKQKEMI